MLDEYIYHGKEKLRCGYTTGSCAAAASKAAAEMLLTGEFVHETQLMTPKDIELHLPTENAEISEGCASCAIRKDSGDDPDITNGILVYAKAERIPFGIEIDGGKGIGRVTKAGLDQPVGNAAINSVPRKMISAAVTEICEKYDYHGGIRITISVPDGEQIALKTYNPRMGIEGGISIIGTSGIVEPMSSRALIDTIKVEERMRRSEGRKNLLLTIGNYSQNFLAENMPMIMNYGVKCSNYIGDAIDIALELGFESVLIVGHIGKLVKLGAGIMNTHSAQADGRMDVLVTCGVMADVDPQILKKLTACATVDAALDELDKANAVDRVAAVLMEKAQYYLDAKVKGEIRIGAVMFSDKRGIIGMTSSANGIIKTLMEEYNG